ncbi:hypothetical protein BC831DRAFT_489764 [Entophlyctis helioformis]|nr:hypothetical protein BC831DRAFT_489764 [Entophlyctis helioformis]
MSVDLALTRTPIRENDAVDLVPASGPSLSSTSSQPKASIRQVIANELAPPHSFQEFLDFLKTEHCEENLEFVHDVEEYRKLALPIFPTQSPLLSSTPGTPNPTTRQRRSSLKQLQDQSPSEFTLGRAHTLPARYTATPSAGPTSLSTSTTQESGSVADSLRTSIVEAQQANSAARQPEDSTPTPVRRSVTSRRSSRSNIVPFDQIEEQLKNKLSVSTASNGGTSLTVPSPGGSDAVSPQSPAAVYSLPADMPPEELERKISALKTDIARLVETYIDTSAPKEINLPERTRKRILLDYQAKNYHPDVFKAAVEHITNMLRQQPFPKFLAHVAKMNGGAPSPVTPNLSAPGGAGRPSDVIKEASKPTQSPRTISRLFSRGGL